MKSTFALAALLFGAPLFGRGTPQVLIESKIVQVGPGILSANFGTNLGNLYANFPSDLKPGDRVSGTLAAIPKGNKDSERDANAKILNSLTVNVCGSDFPVVGRLFACPRVTDSGSIEIILKAVERDLDRLTLAVPRVATREGRQSFVLPTEGIAFNRARILGPFDGDLSDTSIRIGDKAAHLVAESRDSCVFDVPADPIGQTRIELREGGTAATGGAFRAVGLILTPPRRIIHTGDSTSFGAKVTGLAGLARPLRLQLRNLSTAIVSMEAGEEQDVTIAPSAVSPDGTFSITRRLTGEHPGDAVINVSIPWSEESFR